MNLIEQLPPLVRNAIASHAQGAMPNECCGLLIASRATGALAYLMCRNIFPNGQDRFEIHPDDWVACEEVGDVVAVVHSHPNASANPSMADRVGCERSGLPWLVIGMPSGVMKEVHPCGWKAPYEGREFSHGVLDCYTLIQDWYRREPDLQIELPDFDREDDWWKGDADLYLQHMAEAGFVAVQGPLQRHDVILMAIRSRKANHGAIYRGDGVILHHLVDRLSCTDVYGGYWERNTVLVGRHWTRIPGARKP